MKESIFCNLMGPSPVEPGLPAAILGRPVALTGRYIRSNLEQASRLMCQFTFDKLY